MRKKSDVVVESSKDDGDGAAELDEMKASLYVERGRSLAGGTRIVISRGTMKKFFRLLLDMHKLKGERNLMLKLSWTLWYVYTVLDNLSGRCKTALYNGILLFMEELILEKFEKRLEQYSLEHQWFKSQILFRFWNVDFRKELYFLEVFLFQSVCTK